MRQVTITHPHQLEQRVHLVLEAWELPTYWTPDLNFLVLDGDEVECKGLEKVAQALPNVLKVRSPDLLPGDVVVPRAATGHIQVLFRENDQHHGLLLTNRCNSYCIMCSQPPTKHNDNWLIQEALDVVRHIRKSPASLGLSGGEPLLVGKHLRTILEEIERTHPDTRIEVLTNGRLLGNSNIAQELLEGLKTNVAWLVPLYGHAHFIHDFVVQSHGAFEETLAGLLNLQQYQQSIQLRIVLVKPVLEVLPELCHYIGRNLPFVREVALMACEPTGFALANRDHCELDLIDWKDSIKSAGKELQRHRVPFLLMNTPLCALTPELRSKAHRSISDWKQTYADECNSCSVKAECCGLFAWHERGWKPTKIRAIKEETGE